MMRWAGIDVYPVEILEPDYFKISDWRNPKQSASPMWLSIFRIMGKYYAHPTVISKLKEQLK